MELTCLGVPDQALERVPWPVLDRPDFRQRFLDGSSLNGLGKKYPLVDHLQSSDVTDVLAALKCENLL